jgi:hypothetical protein
MATATRRDKWRKAARAPPEDCRCRHRPDRAQSGAARSLRRSGRRWDPAPSQAANRWVCHRRPAGCGRSAPRKPPATGKARPLRPPFDARAASPGRAPGPRMSIRCPRHRRSIGRCPLTSRWNRCHRSAAVDSRPGMWRRAAGRATGSGDDSTGIPSRPARRCRMSNSRCACLCRSARCTLSGREQAHSTDRLRSAAPALTSSPCFEPRKALDFERKGPARCGWSRADGGQGRPKQPPPTSVGYARRRLRPRRSRRGWSRFYWSGSERARAREQIAS